LASTDLFGPLDPPGPMVTEQVVRDYLREEVKSMAAILQSFVGPLLAMITQMIEQIGMFFKTWQFNIPGLG